MHSLEGVVADEEDGVPQRAAPHMYIGACAEGTAQAAGGCPHHLHRDGEQELSVTIHPGIPHPPPQDPSAGLRPTTELHPT